MSLFYKISAFLLTFLGYAGLHSLRQGWSYSNQQLEDQFQVSDKFLGIVDSLYLISYSSGMAILGSFIHKFSLKNYILVGLVFSSLSYMSFAIMYGIFGFFNVAFMTIFMCINGFFQATGWPGMMGIFGNWFEKNKKGALMGVWGVNANVGNIIGSSLCNVLQTHGASWIFNFYVTGFFTLTVAVLIFLFLKEKPDPQPANLLIEEKNLEEKTQNLEESIITEDNSPEQSAPKKLKYGIFSVLLLPKVPSYAIGYACLKGCMYGLLFWLPIFLDKKHLTDQKGYIASMVDLGCLIGGTFVGYLSDRYNRPALFLSPFLFLSAIVMFVVAFFMNQTAWQYYIAMFLIGCFIGGPYNIIGTVIAIDIGNTFKNIGYSVTGVSSFIEGTAALFCAVSMVFIPYIPFQDMFYLFSSQAIVATIVLLPLFIQEYKAVQAKSDQEEPLKTQENDR